MTGVVSFAGVANASPTPSVSDTQAQIVNLQNQAEQATNVYDGVQSQVDTLNKQLNETQNRVADEQNAMNQLRDQIGVIASAQYRDGGMSPQLQLLLSSNPTAYLQQTDALAQVNSQEAQHLKDLSAEARSLQQDSTEATNELAQLEQLRQQLDTAKTAVQSKLSQAQNLLNTLSWSQRQAIENPPSTSTSTTHSSTPKVDLSNLPVPSGRAGEAIAFAESQIGKPYGWGATGPNSWDCSGLTQAAWAHAGVSLPRTTYDQINAGTRIPESALQPGDLVFFNDDQHVGIYIGGGQIVHAPHTGADVRIEAMSDMSYYAAVRVA